MDPITIIVIILVLLWATGTFVYPVGSLIHLLLLIVLVIVVVRLIRGQSVL